MAYVDSTEPSGVTVQRWTGATWQMMGGLGAIVGKAAWFDVPQYLAVMPTGEPLVTVKASGSARAGDARM